jgi:4-diphosphocytidyl-2-C-methyl-D-erythritol kinase
MRAYAKINLGLLILDKRPDGYHTIETVFHRINIFDEIEFKPSSVIKVVSSDTDAPSGEENICYKAARRMQEHLNLGKGAEISIRKSIPVGAGLGGGSSDAGVVLGELAKFWERRVDNSTLRNIALQLGSDVPYFLGTGSALAKGRGEVLEYFKLDIPFTILLCTPKIHVSTAWAYQNVRPSEASRPIDLKGVLLEGLKKPVHLVNGLRNDFEPAVFREYPEIMRVKEAMMRGGAEFALMSGSGSSVFGFFSQGKFADEVSSYLRSRDHQTFLTDPNFAPS